MVRLVYFLSLDTDAVLPISPYCSASLSSFVKQKAQDLALGLFYFHEELRVVQFCLIVKLERYKKADTHSQIFFRIIS